MIRHRRRIKWWIWWKDLKIQHESLLLRHETLIFWVKRERKGDERFEDLLHDEKEDDIVRHEAAEALWAVCCLTDGEYEALDDILKYCDHPSEPLSHAAREARHGGGDAWGGRRIGYESSRMCVSIENSSSYCRWWFSIQILRSCWCDSERDAIDSWTLQDMDESKMMLERYRCMFTLRNLEVRRQSWRYVKPSRRTRVLLSCVTRLRLCWDKWHRCATWVTNPFRVSLEFLLGLRNDMVRHEAALAISCLGTWNKKSYNLALKVLQKYAQDKDHGFRCECALDDLIQWMGCRWRNLFCRLEK